MKILKLNTTCIYNVYNVNTISIGQSFFSKWLTVNVKCVPINVNVVFHNSYSFPYTICTSENSIPSFVDS